MIGKLGLMIKEPKNKRTVAISASLLLCALLGSSLLALSMTGVLGRWLGQKTETPLSLTQEDQQSTVLPLVSLSPTARASQLETVAAGAKSLDQFRARYLLASDLIDQKQGKKALKWLEKLESEYPQLAAHVVLKRAQAYQLMGDQGKETATWQDLLKNYPTMPVAAEALYILGKSDPKYWQEAIAKFPSHPRTQEIVRTILAKKPNQFALLSLLAKNNPSAKATAPIRDILTDKFAPQLTPQDWQIIAFGYWETQEYGKAAKAYARAPRTSLTAYRVGRGYQLDNKKTEAIQAYQQLVKDFPDGKETGLGLKRLAALSSSENALVYLDLIIKKFPDEGAEALLSKAQILESLGSTTSASQARQSVLTQFAKSDAAAQYRWKIAEQKAREGKYQEAWQWAQPITVNNPDSELAPEAAFWVGRWAAELGKQKEATTAFEHVLAEYPESYYAWRSAKFLGWNVGDFTTVRNLTPEVKVPAIRATLPAGSATLKELYQLGQDNDAWTLWQAEFQNRQKPTVAEQFTEGLMRFGVGDHLEGIFHIWSLNQREVPEEKAQWQTLRSSPAYWHALFPFPYKDAITKWSGQRQLNPLLVTALIRQESRFEPKIRSVVGATGLMQVMPETGTWIAEKIQLKKYNLENTDDNIKLGTWFLDYTHQEYNNNSMLAVASYNAGPAKVGEWVTKFGLSDPDAFIEVIPYLETKGYVESVFGNYWNYLRLYNPEISQMLSKYTANGPILSR